MSCNFLTLWILSLIKAKSFLLKKTKRKKIHYKITFKKEKGNVNAQLLLGLSLDHTFNFVGELYIYLENLVGP